MDIQKRRLIKLKEYGINLTETKICPTNYLQISAGTEFVISTDNNGFIKTGNYDNSNYNVYDGEGDTIIILGDSFVECMFVPEKNRFCSVAERILVEKYNKKYFIYNGGMSGSHMLTCIFSLLAKVIPLNPKIVILFLPAIDFGIARFVDGYWNNDKNYSIFFNISNKSEEMRNADISYLTESKYLTMIDIFVNILKKFKIDYYICSRPYLKRNDIRREMNKIALSHCKKEKYKYFDFDMILEDRCSTLFYDNIHLHEQGSIIMGEVLAKTIYNYMK